jgi:Type II secretion system (T2SS), protein N
MRIFLIALVGLLAAAAGGLTLLPMSMAADIASQRFPDFKFKQASGSVWDGKLSQVAFGRQFIGDLAVKAEFMSLLTGKAAGKLGLTREGFAGEADLIYGISNGSLEIRDMKLDGNTALVPGMPAAIARVDGKFSLQVKDIQFADSVCESANGEVWTDALTKVNVKGWVGPELRGPVTCEGGKLLVQATGKAVTGEDVVANLSIGQHLDMALTATVTNLTPGAIQALRQVGFVPEGDHLVLHHAMGGS